MCLVKKCIVRSLLSVVAFVSTNVFFVLDYLTGISFLIDTGTCRSLLPKSMVHSGCSPGTDIHLIAANGSRIINYGYKFLQLSFSGSTFQWQFIIAEVSIPLIGADFLSHFHLLVDVINRRLINTTTLASTTVTAVPADFALQINYAKDDYASLRSSFPKVFWPELYLAPRTPADHNICHFIWMSGPPVFSKFHRLAPDKLNTDKKMFKDMEDMGLCQKALSPWSSPLHIVTKKDGTLCPAVTTGAWTCWRSLTITLPNIADVTTYLHGAKIFSKLDILKGYYQVPKNPADIPKTTITMPFGAYTFNYSCFGLRNAGATFQRIMDNVLVDLPFCIAYVEDILIFSTTPDKHRRHLH